MDQRWIWLSLLCLLLIQGVMTASGRGKTMAEKMTWIFRNVDWRRKKSEMLADSISSLRKSLLSRLMESLCLFIHVSSRACLFNFFAAVPQISCGLKDKRNVCMRCVYHIAYLVSLEMRCVLAMWKICQEVYSVELNWDFSVISAEFSPDSAVWKQAWSSQTQLLS